MAQTAVPDSVGRSLPSTKRTSSVMSSLVLYDFQSRAERQRSITITVQLVLPKVSLFGHS